MSLNHAIGPDVDSLALAARASAEIGGKDQAASVLKSILPDIDMIPLEHVSESIAGPSVVEEWPSDLEYGD